MRDADFDAIFIETKTAVLAAVSRTLSPHLSHCKEDVIQETYLSCYTALERHLTGNSPIQDLPNYLYRAAKNESIRWNKRYQKEINRQQWVADTQIQNPTDQDQFVSRETVSSLLLTLPTRSAEAIRLWLEGYSMVDISKRLRLSVGTVKSSLNRSKLKLKSSLKEAYDV